MQLIALILPFIAIFLVFNLILKQSFRELDVEVPKGKNIVSPAYGKVIDVVDISNKDTISIKKGLLGLINSTTKGINKGYLISIFMRPFDNHINRAPIGGKILSIKHYRGKFRRANSLRALQNERTEIVMDTKIGKLKMLQIAGYIFRRIETSVKEGQKLIKGDKIGLIRHGSQVSLIVPKKIKIKIKKGDRVKAGSTILGEI